MSFTDKNKGRRKIQLASAAGFIMLLIFGWFYPLMGFFAVICMVAAVAIGFFKGRKWCDLCPRGSFYDIPLKSLSGNKIIPGFFRSWKTRGAIILLMMTVMGIQVIGRWPDLISIGLFFMIFLTVTTFVGVVLGAVIHQRTWCCFCPIGTMGNLAGSGKHLMSIDSDKCTECGLCANVCPMQLKPHTHKENGIRIVNEPDCLKCGLCIERCPTKALTFKT